MTSKLKLGSMVYCTTVTIGVVAVINDPDTQNIQIDILWDFYGNEYKVLQYGSDWNWEEVLHPEEWV